MTQELPENLNEYRNPTPREVPTIRQRREPDIMDRFIELADRALPILDKFADAYNQAKGQQSQKTQNPVYDPLNPTGNPLITGRIIGQDGVHNYHPPNAQPVIYQNPPEHSRGQEQAQVSIPEPDWSQIFDDLMAYLENYRETPVGDLVDELMPMKNFLIREARKKLGFDNGDSTEA